MKSFSELKRIHRALRDSFDENFSIRMHRSLSWLNKSEMETDPDAKFIFLWIAFNAAYSSSTKSFSISCDEELRTDFFKLLLIKGNIEIHKIIWERYSSEIRSILNNEFILRVFWENQIDSNSDWKSKLTHEKKEVERALIDKKDTIYILLILFKRLYVLRNQMFHGGATWQGKLNRRQVNDGAKILSHLVPIFLDVMMSNPNEDWGPLTYPPMNED